MEDKLTTIKVYRKDAKIIKGLLPALRTDADRIAALLGTHPEVKLETLPHPVDGKVVPAVTFYKREQQ